LNLRRRFESTSAKLTKAESLESQVPHHNLGTLWVLEIASLAFVVTAPYGTCSAAIAYMIWKKRGAK